jgi:glycerol kinase
MILGIDQGTTGSTAVLLSEDGRPLSSATAAVPQHFPKPGWVEHDPDEIWQSVESAVSAALHKVSRPSSDIRLIGLTNQRETVSLFHEGRALHRFLVWQDRRTADGCMKLAKYSKEIRRLSGTPIDPYFSSTKIRWLLDHLKIKRPGRGLRFRTIDSFLFERLCGVDAIECTNAHRTQLMDLKKLQWSSRLLDIFKIPESLCPPIVPSEGFEFKTKALGFLPAGIPVVAALGDQQAALFAQLGWNSGEGKITYGTGSFILVNTGEKPVHSKSELVSTVALQRKNGKATYALEGSVFICGAWIQWLRDQLQMIGKSSEIEELAMSVPDSEGVLVVPALTGMGAPFWNPKARGLVGGLTRGTNRGHIARASLEALAFQNLALINAIKKDAPQIKFSEWKVDGGASQNNLLMQIQADSLQKRILRPQNLEATATGAALLAAQSRGLLSDKEIKSLWKADRVFEPQKSIAAALTNKYLAWTGAVRVA